MVLQTCAIRLDFRVSGIFKQRLGNNLQAQCTHRADTNCGDARILLDTSTHQREQLFRRRDLAASDGNPGLASVRAKLKVGAGDPWAGRLL